MNDLALIRGHEPTYSQEAIDEEIDLNSHGLASISAEVLEEEKNRLSGLPINFSETVGLSDKIVSDVDIYNHVEKVLSDAKKPLKKSTSVIKRSRPLHTATATSKVKTSEKQQCFSDVLTGSTERQLIALTVGLLFGILFFAIGKP